MRIPTQLWRSTLELSDLWSKAPIIHEYSEVLIDSRTAGSDKGGIAAHLRGTYAGLDALQPHVLRQYSLLSMVRSQVPAIVPGMNWEDPELPAFMERARLAESAYLTTLQWIRSRIPGYPSIKVPQLAKGSPLRTEEFTWRAPWLTKEFPGIQYSLKPPEEIGRNLGNASLSRMLQDAAFELVAALRRSDHWAVYTEALAQLNSTDKNVLNESVRLCAARLRSDAIDQHEPQNVLRRYAYRSAVVSEALAELPAGAGAYAHAFQELDYVLRTVLEEVFPQLVCSRPVRRIRDPRRLMVDANMVKWQTHNFEINIGTIGDLVLIEDPILAEYAQVTLYNINFGRIDGEIINYEARILDGALSAWGTKLTARLAGL